MRFLDYIRVALKNLWRQKGRTFLTVFAVVIGAVSVLVMLSLVFGARSTVTEQLEKIGGLTMITVTPSQDASGDSDLISSNTGPADGGKLLTDTVLAQMKALPHVADAAPLTGVQVGKAMLEGGDKKIYPQIVGYPPSSSVLTVDLVAGRLLTDNELDKIVISTEMLTRLGYTGKPDGVIGKKLTFYVPGGQTNSWMPDPAQPPANADRDYYENQNKTEQQFTADIVGVSSGGMGGDQSYITLTWAKKLMTYKMWQMDEEANKAAQEACQVAMRAQQQLQSRPGSGPSNGSNLPECQQKAPPMKLVLDDQLVRNGYSSILLRSDGTGEVEGIADAVRKLGYGATTAKQILDQIGKIFTALTLVLGAIGGISLLVSAIGIINTMVMATYERIREIGVLRACGATRANIRRLFTFEAALLGFLGGLVGTGTSYLIGQVGNQVIKRLAAGQSLPIDQLMRFPIWLVASVIGFTTIIGLLAGLYPAIRAARLDPVEALRHE